MSRRVSGSASGELADVVAQLNEALAALDRLKTPQYIGARLDHVIGEINGLLGASASGPIVRNRRKSETAVRPAA